MPMAYSYLRFSSPRQKRGTSEIRQIEGLKEGQGPGAWCKENGYTLDTLLRAKISDKGKSGFHGHHIQRGGKRGGLGLFLDAVEDGTVKPGDVLLIEHLDRFTRQDPMTGLKYVQQIISRGVDIVTLMDGERYSAERLAKDFACLMKIMFLLFQNNEESVKKQARLLDVWRRKRADARNGKPTGAKVPAWIDRKTGQVIEGKADIVRRIYALALDGNGPLKITRILNGEGVPVLKRAKRWTVSNVQYYLSTPTVIGAYQPCRYLDGKSVPEGDPIPGYYPPIIEDQTYRDVRRIMGGRKRQGVRGRTADTRNLFTRMIYSMFDGGRYHFKENKRTSGGKTYRRNWLVPFNGRQNVKGSLNLSIEYDSFEKAFTTFVKEADASELFAPRGAAEKAKELAEVNGLILDKTENIRTTRDQAKRAKHIGPYLSLIEEMEEERQALISRAEALRAEVMTSEAQIFEESRAALDDPTARGKVASAYWLLIERINILPIHTRTSFPRKNHYLLFVEVRFNNGQHRFFVTDETGAIKPGMGISKGKAYTLGYSMKGKPERVNGTLQALIDQASDAYRPMLTEWLQGRLAEG